MSDKKGLKYVPDAGENIKEFLEEMGLNYDALDAEGKKAMDAAWEGTDETDETMDISDTGD